VAALRRGIEFLHRQAQQAPAVPDAPDYSPTLGAIAQKLRAVGKRLDGIEEHPALTLTPIAYATQVTAGVRRMEDEAGRSLTHAQGQFSDALHEMRSLICSTHSQFAQQRREWIAIAIGVVVGLVLWYPLVWLTPFGGDTDRLRALASWEGTDAGGGLGIVGADGPALQRLPAGQHDRSVRGGNRGANHPVRAAAGSLNRPFGTSQQNGAVGRRICG
jgi:hypothetical protein